MTYIVTSSCIDIKDKACIEECPVSCIFEGSRMSYINPEQCIDCGACEPVCPTNAISHESMVSVEEKNFIEINKNFFQNLDLNEKTVFSFSNMDSEEIKGYEKK